MNPWGCEAAKHSENIKSQEACVSCKLISRYNAQKFSLAQLLNIRIDSRKNSQRHKENHENIKKLQRALLEDCPERNSTASPGHRLTPTRLLLLLFTHHLMITEESVQWHGKVGIKTKQNDKHGSNEVINRCLSNCRPNWATCNADNCRECSTNIATKHNCSGVFSWKFCCHTVNCILENSSSHYKKKAINYFILFYYWQVTYCWGWWQWQWWSKRTRQAIPLSPSLPG